MNEPDASRRGECVATGHEPDASDASDAFDACEDGAEQAHGEAPDHRGSAGKRGEARTLVGRAKAASAGRASSGGALLDSLSRFDPPNGTGEARAVLDRFERRVPCEVLRVLWPVLEAHRGQGLDLLSLSLTSPHPDAIAEAAEHFVSAAAHDPGSGVLLARDVGANPSHAHFHGVALTGELPALRSLWSELAGAHASLSRAIPVRGWAGYCTEPYERALAPNLTRVVWYAFKPLPAGVPPRSLGSDVFASGPFAAAWRAARGALEAVGRSAPEDAAEASARRRTCGRCGRSFSPRKRSHAIWCSPNCRKAASAASLARASPSRGRTPHDERAGDSEPKTDGVHTPSGVCT